MNNVEQHDSVCKELNQLYKQKNQDYGDSFHETFLEEGMAMARIRLTDKLNRFKRLTKHESVRSVADESVRDTLIDLANYAIMTVMELDREVPFMSKTAYESPTVRDGVEEAVSKTDVYEPWVDKVRNEWESILNKQPIPRAGRAVKDSLYNAVCNMGSMSKTDTPMSKTEYDDAECECVRDWVKDNANDMD